MKYVDIKDGAIKLGKTMAVPQTAKLGDTWKATQNHKT
jgi:hypothetical protein